MSSTTDTNHALTPGNMTQNNFMLSLNSFKSLFFQFIHSVSGDIENYAKKKEKLILPRISKTIIIDLCRESESIFRSEPSLIDIKSPCLIIGDLHGHVLDLFRILKYCGIPSDDCLNPKFKDDTNFELGNNRKLQHNNKYVFLGDIIDRGEFSVETITIVLLLKVLFPSNVYLIRGNHEFDFLAKQCGFLEQVNSSFSEYDIPTSSSTRYGELWSSQPPEFTSGAEVYSAFMSTFSYIPFSIRIDDKMLCVHGGIGPQVFSVKSISQIKRPITEFGVNDVADSLLWSDPSDKPDLGNRPEMNQLKSSSQIPPPNSLTPTIPFSIPLINPLFSTLIENKSDIPFNSNTNDSSKLFEPSSRGTGFIFGGPALFEFLHYSNLEVLVRAHECVIAGCEEMFNGRLITVFSASNYCGFVRNYSSVLHVKSEEEYESEGKGNSSTISERCEVFRFYPLDYLRKPIPITINANNNYDRLSARSGNSSARYLQKNSQIPQLAKTPINGTRDQYKISSARSQPEEGSQRVVSPHDIHKMAGIKISQASSFSKGNVNQISQQSTAVSSSPLPPISMKRNRTNRTELPALVFPTNRPKGQSVLSSHPTPHRSSKSAIGIALTAKMKPRSRSEFK